MPFEFRYDEDGSLSVESAVFQSLGLASTCWASLDHAGEFQSDKAKEIGDTLIKWLRENQHLVVTAPWLGLATTEELLEELATRMKISQNSTAGRKLGILCEEAIDNLASNVLAYKTAGSR